MYTSLQVPGTYAMVVSSSISSTAGAPMIGIVETNNQTGNYIDGELPCLDIYIFFG
jgi:hypothetical protein